MLQITLIECQNVKLMKKSIDLMRFWRFGAGFLVVMYTKNFELLTRSQSPQFVILISMRKGKICIFDYNSQKTLTAPKNRNLSLKTKLSWKRYSLHRISSKKYPNYSLSLIKDHLKKIARMQSIRR